MPQQTNHNLHRLRLHEVVSMGMGIAWLHGQRSLGTAKPQCTNITLKHLMSVYTSYNITSSYINRPNPCNSTISILTLQIVSTHPVVCIDAVDKAATTTWQSWVTKQLGRVPGASSISVWKFSDPGSLIDVVLPFIKLADITCATSWLIPQIRLQI